MSNSLWLENMRGHFSGRWQYPGRMGPQLTYGRHHIPPLAGYRRAAVLILLSPDSPSTDVAWRDISWHLTLTSRAFSLAHHAGQVCFPGGRRDDDESDAECALREWCEELGPLPDSVHSFGALPDIYVFASHHWVCPVLALTPLKPKLRANPAEVDHAFSLPLATINELPTSRRTVKRGGLSFESPQYDTDHGGIWGATAMMMELLALIWSRRPQ